MNPVFAPLQTQSNQLSVKSLAAASMRTPQSVDYLIRRHHPRLPTITAATHHRPVALSLRKSKRLGRVTTLASSSLLSAQPSSSSKTAPSSSYAAISARATALGPTTSSTKACVASSHTSVRSTMSKRPLRVSCSAALIVWCLRTKSSNSSVATSILSSSQASRRSM